MGFLFFTLLLLPAMLLYAAVQAALSPFAGVLAPVLVLIFAVFLAFPSFFFGF